MITKSLKDISWQVSEEEYRADKALSYSTLAKFKRTGFKELNHLFDKTESPSLTFGSAVDSIITGGEEEFNNRFITAKFPSIPDSIIPIIKVLYNEYKDKYSSLYDIPDTCIIDKASLFNYQNNWKPETRAKVIKEKASEYYKLLYIAGDKTILSTDTYIDVCKAVEALRSSPATKWYFEKDNPWDNIERLYQLKFKSIFDNIPYRCMMDLCIIDHDKKVIYPIDLKTSHKPEYEFYKSFVEFSYAIQSRLYWRILRDNLNKDQYFKDFKLENYRFIVVNRTTLNPLVWEFNKTTARGTLIYGKDGQIELSDPEEIGKELYIYLSENRNVPIGINENNLNNIDYWLNSI